MAKYLQSPKKSDAAWLNHTLAKKKRRITMKAIIFNSGLGNRMGKFTETHHKSMAPLKNGESIFERQLRLLSAEGVKDYVITTS